MRKLILPAIIMLAVTGCKMTTGSKAQYYLGDTQKAEATVNAPQEAKTAVVEDMSLKAIIDNAWQINVDYSPQMAASLGDESKAGQLADLSPETLAEKNLRQKTLLLSLKQLDKDKLSKTDRINAQLLQYQLQNSVDMYTYKDHYLPITAESGFHAYIASIANARLNNTEDYQHYLKKLNALPQYFAQQTFWLKQGSSSGITPAKVTLDGFEDSISAYIVAVEDSGYYKPFTEFPEHFTQAQKTQLAAEGKKSH